MATCVGNLVHDFVRQAGVEAGGQGIGVQEEGLLPGDAFLGNLQREVNTPIHHHLKQQDLWRADMSTCASSLPWTTASGA